MRAAALPALIVGTVLQATPVRSLRAPPPQSPLWQALYPEAAPFEEQDEPDDYEFEVRVTPDEVKAFFPTLPLTGFRRPEREIACPVLHLGVSAARKLYVHDGTDGLGSRILNIIGALKYAEKLNIGFGGLFSRGEAPTSHFVNISAALQAFFCTAACDLYVDALPQDTQIFPTLQALSLQLEEGAVANEPHVYVETRGSFKGVNHHIQISPTILAALRVSNTPIMQMPLVRFQPRDLNVAVHVRRGDVGASVPGRGTTYEYYVWLMKIMQSKVPYAKFHIFSERGRRSNNDEFVQYSKLGATVNLDTEATETLAHFARADVLVTAKSSFSYAAALLNPNCVLSQKWMLAEPGWVPLPETEWMLGNDAIEMLSHQIGSCMLSIAARKHG